MSVNTLSPALSPLKGAVTQSLGLGATYANDFILPFVLTYNGSPAMVYVVLKTAAVSAANLIADTAGYAKFPGGSVAFINASGVQTVRKAGNPDDTTGTWTLDT